MKKLKTLHDRVIEYQKKGATLSKSIKLAQRNTEQSRYRRLSRLYDRTLRMWNHPNFVLLTFTFTDDSLKTTSEKYRNRVVKEWSRKYLFEYVGNIDYGSKNGREHYHVVGIYINRINHKTWVYGALNWQVQYSDNYKGVAKYIEKLKNHYVKDSAGKVFYSRMQKECVIK